MQSIRKRFAPFLLQWTFFASVLLLGLIIALPFWRIVPLSKEQSFIPLHYNIYFGVDRFGPWYAIFVIPAIGLLFLVINLAMQVYFSQTDRTLTRFFALSTICIQIMLLVSMGLIVLLNV